ncbi:MAG: D-alanyl-D-alanine carboxypeptidase/D-alanyl-D-alanine-endopeptidase [Rhodocyclaceae bacterium]|nr:D-alanyl-D-alanine carboxypeptidase/D-alanyl-D-alanine-endopeptidase [Rhodocyclaceae bacterium]
MLRRWIIGGVASALLSTAAMAQLPARVTEMLRISNMSERALGVAVIRLSDGKLVWSQFADQSMQPASTIKVLTAIVGLDKLGPAYRSRTVLLATAPVVEGVLQGDLTLRGEGNTDITWEDFQRMLQSLRHRGIREIAGNLIVDRTFFSPTRLDIGLAPFDESPEFRYNVIPDALLINTNVAQFDIDSTAGYFQLRLTPPLDGVKVISNMTLVERSCEKWEDGWKIPTVVNAAADDLRIYLEGEYPKNCTTTTNLNVVDRAEYAARLFGKLWRDLGGTIKGAVIETQSPSPEASNTGAATSPVRVLAEHRARPLAEVSRNINKVSDNTITRMIYLTLGTDMVSRATAEGRDMTARLPTLTRAENEVKDWLKQRGIDTAGIVLDNGSGLSRSERISPRQLASVLQAAHRSKWAPEFLSSLPIVAVDGSMRSRLKDSPAAETARIKTGGLRNVVSVAGYVTNAAGEVHAVVGMVNDDRAALAGGRAILDALLDEVARSNTTSGSTK